MTVVYSSRDIADARARWLAYLRSPGLSKHVGFLGDPDDPARNCVLGHAAALFGAERRVDRGLVFYMGDPWGMGNSQVLPEAVARRLDITPNGKFLDPILLDGGEYNKISRVNDRTALTLAEMADILERGFQLGLMRPFVALGEEGWRTRILDRLEHDESRFFDASALRRTDVMGLLDRMVKDGFLDRVTPHGIGSLSSDLAPAALAVWQAVEDAAEVKRSGGHIMAASRILWGAMRSAGTSDLLSALSELLGGGGSVVAVDMDCGPSASECSVRSVSAPDRELAAA